MRPGLNEQPPEPVPVGYDHLPGAEPLNPADEPDFHAKLERLAKENPFGGGTLADLLDKTIEPLRFVVDLLIPEGLTVLAGKPKLGKSWLALGIAMAVCAGHDTLGHKTTLGEVLYIALEDSDRRMQDRVITLGGRDMEKDALQRFHYRTDWPVFGQGGLDELEQWMDDHPDTRLIVVDTFARIRGDLPGRDRYAEEYGLLGGVQSFAVKHRLAVVMIHHLRKQGADDWLEQISGSQAITGASDTILGLFRERGQMDATLRLISREVDESDIALKFDNGQWLSMGDAVFYRYTAERVAVLEAFRDLGGEGRTSDVATLIGKTVAATSRLIIKLAAEGQLTNTRYGVYSLNHPVEVVEQVKSTPPTSTTSTTSRGLDDQGKLGRPELSELGEADDLAAAEANIRDAFPGVSVDEDQDL